MHIGIRLATGKRNVIPQTNAVRDDYETSPLARTLPSFLGRERFYLG